jgi:hypothetical protein
MLASASAAPLSMSRGAPATPGSRYLALGDSVTFGTEDPQVIPAPNGRRVIPGAHGHAHSPGRRLRDSLKGAQIRALVQCGDLQLSLFDETNAGALDREKQLAVVRQFTDLVAAAAVTHPSPRGPGFC